MNGSSGGFTVRSHFVNKDEWVREIYDQLLKTAKGFGRVIEALRKTSIHLVNSTAFAGVATRKNSLNLTLKGDHKLASPRIHKTEQVSARRFHHELKLTSPDELDGELSEWLREAYLVSE